MNIKVDHIGHGKENRPSTNPASSLYKKNIKPAFIVYHNPAAPNWDAEQLHDYGKRQYVRPGVKSWNYSVDKDNVYEMVPVGEATWQAGDNLGPGNTSSISMEVCDRGAYAGDWDLFWADQENAAKLCAYLIETVDSLRPYPECMKQHYDFSGKNCPSWLRNNEGWWKKLVDMVGEYLRDSEETEPKTYRVVVASNTDYNRSLEDLQKTQKAFPTQSPFIVLNNVNDARYYRVVIAEVDRIDIARALADKAKERLSSGWIVSEWEDINFEPPGPEEKPKKPDKPDIPDDNTGPEEKPEEPELPSGLKEFLRMVYEWLKDFFNDY